MKERYYIAIDLKSFYASVECVERGLDPLDTNLVVADESRTEKTICLAVTPALKACGIPGRPRLFEVIQSVNQINAQRKHDIPDHKFTGGSSFASELEKDKSLELTYIIAPPRMAYYMQYSTEIYSIYLKYIAPEDIIVYSIDEVFIDVTSYLDTYRMTAHELALTIIRDVLRNTGITATAGIGTNLYLAKIAMDIKAKKMPADEDGVRIAQLDEMSYRKELWTHTPITDFWRIGSGYAKKLRTHGMTTMGDVARCSLTNETLLYKLFGINAELLIDHAWGWEPCLISDVKAYRPENKCISSGQVLQSPYTAEKARLVIQEMADSLSLDLVDKKLSTDQIVITAGYDTESLSDPETRKKYSGEVTSDRYGRPVPKHAHGTENLKRSTSSARLITEAALKLYDRIIDSSLLVRRLNITANHVMDESRVKTENENRQLDLFTDYETLQKEEENETKSLEKERKMQEAVITIKKKYGKNSVFKGMNMQEDATALQRNEQIGGHKA